MSRCRLHCDDFARGPLCVRCCTTHIIYVCITALICSFWVFARAAERAALSMTAHDSYSFLMVLTFHARERHMTDGPPR